LMPGRAYVDDGEAAMAQARAPPPVIQKGRCPYAFIVTPAMRYARKHSADARVRLHCDQSGNTTHDFAREDAESPRTSTVIHRHRNDCAPIIDE
jgi:hypothetical protein